MIVSRLALLFQELSQSEISFAYKEDISVRACVGGLENLRKEIFTASETLQESEGRGDHPGPGTK